MSVWRTAPVNAGSSKIDRYLSRPTYLVVSAIGSLSCTESSSDQKTGTIARPMMITTAGRMYSHALGVSPNTRWRQVGRGAAAATPARGACAKTVLNGRASPFERLVAALDGLVQRVRRRVLAQERAGDRLPKGRGDLRIGLDDRPHARVVERLDERAQPVDLGDVLLPDVLPGGRAAQRQTAGLDVPARVLGRVGEPLDALLRRARPRRAVVE